MEVVVGAIPLTPSFGGKPGFDENPKLPCVENVGGRGVKALVTLRVELLVNRGLRGLRQYYDRVAWGVKKVSMGRIVVDKDKLWNMAEKHAYKFSRTSSSPFQIRLSASSVSTSLLYLFKKATLLVPLQQIGLAHALFIEIRYHRSSLILRNNSFQSSLLRIALVELGALYSFPRLSAFKDTY